MVAQSALLTALEGSAPAPVLETTATGLTRGLASLWADPTADPTATGLLFGASHASYASVRVFHTTVAWRWGPRWNVTLASTNLGDLFDTSLTNQDPSLSALRAQALWGRLDATLRLSHLAMSLGVALAGDDNVGVMRSSTVTRSHFRVFPFRDDRVAIGVQTSRSIGGSVPAREGGRHVLDLTAKQPVGRSSVGLTVAMTRGSLWRYSETTSGYAVAGQVSLLSRLDLGAAAGRYATTFGTSRAESYYALSGALQVAAFRLGTRFTSTRLGLGSGFALSLAYEPRAERVGVTAP